MAYVQSGGGVGPERLKGSIGTLRIKRGSVIKLIWEAQA
jgi:hypothetical protein